MELLLNTVLPIILYTLGAILLIVLIVLIIQLIQTTKRVNSIMDDVEKKVKSLDGIFHIIDFVTDKVSSVSDLFVDKVSGLISNLFTKKKKKKKEEKIDE